MKNSNIASRSARNSKAISRKRFIMLRCFKAWRVQTFGLVSPNVAREHFQKKLLIKYIKIWHNSYKQNRKDWKLQIRAEYHDRFRLWKMSFQQWKAFLSHRKMKKMLVQRTIEHAQHKLKERSFSNLRMYLVIKRMRKEEHEAADMFYKKSNLRKYWRLWLLQFNNECLLHNMSYTALQHWANTMVKKMFIRWKDQFKNRCDLNQKLTHCTAFYNQKLIYIAVCNWKKFIRLKKERKHLQEHAEQTYTKKILQRTFIQWKRSHQLCLHVKQVEERIVKLGELSIKRRYFNRFVTFITLKKEMDLKFTQANKMYETTVKKGVIKGLKDVVRNSQIKTETKRKANDFYVRRVMVVCFSKWLLKCENREEIKQYPVSKIAYSYFRTRQLSKAIFQWLKFVKERKQEAALESLAENHHNKIILPRYFINWIDFTHLQKSIKERQTVAAAFNRTLLHSKYFYTWLKCYQLELIQQQMITEASDYYSESMTKRIFNLWRKKTNFKQFVADLENRAVIHRNRSLLQSALQNWNIRFQEKVSCDAKMTAASINYEHGLKKKCLVGLKKYLYHCRKKKLKEKQALQHYNYKRLKKVMILWKSYHATTKQTIVLAEQRYIEKSQILCSWVMYTWIKFVKIQKKEKELFLKAELHFCRVLKKKILRHLGQYASVRCERRFNIDEAVVRAQIRLEKVKLRTLFGSWRKTASIVHSEKKNSTIAVQHYSCVMYKKVLTSWKSYVATSFKIKHLTAYSMMFATRSIEKRHFSIWKSKYLRLAEEDRKTNTAIWWWSYQLRRKVFTAIHEYTKSKVKKKLKYRSALTYRKNMLLEIGATKWIQYAVHAMDTRRNIAYQHQVKKSMELQSRVHKYALHWLNRTQMKKTSILTENRGVLKGKQSNDSDRACLDQMSTFRAVKFPDTKERPSPRLPDYLRESFDLSAFKKDITTLHMSTQCISRYSSQRYDNIPRPHTYVPTLHSPVINPMERASSDSLKLLELTNDENNQSTIGQKAILLPPSTFTTC
ncbi:protein SFI1 homolog [Hydractinia symbiolongicarpus]|uniref:protein SFI1 homolog n=1 Tax=Hydractinia symbiolongicarpus TaxID=13093 RepID=UPI00254AD19E|nr:protein SFI1 homolog [Hydractinia symbiolongicarpus]